MSNTNIGVKQYYHQGGVGGCLIKCWEILLEKCNDPCSLCAKKALNLLENLSVAKP